jgi:transcriptional regulator with XRE-family HTH domain
LDYKNGFMKIAENMRRLRKLKNLSQKEVAMAIEMKQAQYSVIESGKTIPTIPTLQKIAQVFETDVVELLRNPGADEKEVNLSILEKVKLIDSLEEAEKTALFTVIDMAIAKKKLKDNLNHLLSQ